MEDEIRKQIRFVLEDGNEGLRAALDPDGDLEEENKQTHRELIQQHEQILAKLDKDEPLSQEDWVLVRDANEMHVTDSLNLGGHHRQAVALDKWLDQVMDMSVDKAMRVLEQWLGRNSRTPARVYRALHILWEEATPDDTDPGPAFDDQGRCLKCGSRISLADVADTVVFAGDEIVKRYPGDITNRNCVRHERGSACCTCDWEVASGDREGH